MKSAAPPPLNALRAFEAFARHGGMTAAAAELCVTHGAVSRQVAALQDHEPGQARDQPFQGEGAEAGDFDLAPFVPPGRVDGVGDGREGDGQARRQFCSGGRQGQAVTRADNEATPRCSEARRPDG